MSCDSTVKARIDHCKAVAYWEYHREHGGFLKAFLDAFLLADPGNQLILLPAFERLTEKYHLKEESK